MTSVRKHGEISCKYGEMSNCKHGEILKLRPKNSTIGTYVKIKSVAQVAQLRAAFECITSLN